jgi:SAM-dependent methyltransferase
MKRTDRDFNIQELPYPPEAVIRMFLGNFPNLNFVPEINKRILDLGFGEGRNFPFFNEIGLESYGVEINKNQIEHTESILNKYSIDAELKLGTNQNIPFKDSFFDYILSWNSSYYMTNGDVINTTINVKEFARVLKKTGDLLISIPKHTSFIYNKSEVYVSNIHETGNYIIVKEDPWKIRNGMIMRIYYSIQEIIDEFSTEFDFISNADINDDFFGYNYHWYLIHFKKK